MTGRKASALWKGVMAHSACKRRWKNKANSRRAGRLGGPSNMQNKAKLGQDGTSGRRRVREGQWRKTNPIPARPDTPPFHYSIIPAFRPDANHAKQTQFGPVASIVQNKPDSAAAPGEVSEKQSQSPRAGRTPGVPRPPARARRTGPWGSLGLRLRRLACGVIIPPVQMVRRPQGCLQAQDRVNAELQTTDVEHGNEN